MRVRVNEKCEYLRDLGEIKLGQTGVVNLDDLWHDESVGHIAVILDDIPGFTWCFFDYELDFLND